MAASRRTFAALAAAVAIVATAAVLALALFRSEGFAYQDPFDPLPSREVQGNGTAVDGAPDPQRRLDAFLEFVFADIQGFWARTFERSGIAYVPATLVVFEGATSTGCGPASAAVGPFYCALDRRVYLDAGFFRQLAVEFRAPGDFAQAYVIAHEVGHHVQNLTGVLSQVQQAISDASAAPNELSVRMELQADCLAGVWGHSTYERRMLERGDLEEALRAAAAVGDDRIQRRTTGRIDPETWTHGASEQRRSWWLRGYTAGDPDACDTFSGAV
jgi:predicted metalloprotease